MRCSDAFRTVGKNPHVQHGPIQTLHRSKVSRFNLVISSAKEDETLRNQTGANTVIKYERI